MPKDLIDAATEHHVAAQQDGYHIRVIDHAEPPATVIDGTGQPLNTSNKDLPEGRIPVLGR